MSGTTERLSPAEKLANLKNRRVIRVSGVRDGHSLGMVCRLHSLRTALGLSVKDVAEATNINAAFVARVEGGGNTSVAVAIKLSRFFGKRVEEIWTLPSDEQIEQEVAEAINGEATA